MAATPTTTMNPRSNQSGSRRPTVAPSMPPMVAPTARAPAAHQSISAAKQKNSAATPLTSAASTFLVALSRCSASSMPSPSTAM